MAAAKKVRLRMRNLMEQISTELAATMAAATMAAAKKVRLRMRNLMDV